VRAGCCAWGPGCLVAQVTELVARIAELNEELEAAEKREAELAEALTACTSSGNGSAGGRHCQRPRHHGIQVRGRHSPSLQCSSPHPGTCPRCIGAGLPPSRLKPGPAPICAGPGASPPVCACGSRRDAKVLVAELEVARQRADELAAEVEEARKMAEEISENIFGARKRSLQEQQVGPPDPSPAAPPVPGTLRTVGLHSYGPRHQPMIASCARAYD